MITKQVIDELYKKYAKLPPGIEHLDIGLLFDYVSEHHNVEIDEEGHIVIGSLDPMSPFHKIALERVHGFSQFEETIAIVLHSSIIFLNKNDMGVNVHLKANPPTVWEKLKWWFHKN